MGQRPLLITAGLIADLWMNGSKAGSPFAQVEVLGVQGNVAMGGGHVRVAALLLI